MIDRLEARLGAALAAEGHGRLVAVGVSAETEGKQSAPAEDAAEAVAAAEKPAVENGANVWIDEAAEAAFLSEAKARGEPVAVAAPEAVEDADPKNLPALDELVKRIPADVRATLDELFRAKFVTVRRLPKKALK